MNRLERIVEAKRAELERLRLERPVSELETQAARRRDRELEGIEPRRDFLGALRAGAPTALIGEIKRASPSAGAIRPDVDPAATARAYERAGASALSVLTDREFFDGSLRDLAGARSAVRIPVLRKDFTLDAYHVIEAFAGGADAVLLILAILTDEEAASLQALARKLGIAALVEVHDEEEMRRAATLGADPIGINSRNLRTFEVDLATFERVAPLAPPGVLLVAESGIRTRQDVLRVRAAGAGAVLVGETLMRAGDPAAAVGMLLGRDEG